MQENALHGWKLADGKHMRMTGYPGQGQKPVLERQGQMAGEFRRAGGDRLAVLRPRTGRWARRRWSSARAATRW